MVHEPKLESLSKIPLIWKLGSNADKDIITLVPITGPVERWLEKSLDFLIMPATVIWLAPRYVELKTDGTYSFGLFSELDPNDEAWINISIQQVTSVTPVVTSALREAYLSLIPDKVKQPRVV